MLYIKIFSIFLILMIVPMCVVRAEVKRQTIPVGMFNVYSKDDGNLGLPTPDLREIWEGMPTDWGGGYYPYEACNLVQHYWPRTLPSVQAGQDPHAAWWIDYLRQVYEAGNEDGEIRLRAIVGALYEPYATFGETWFRNFITALCEWERSGPQDGVIAGWYLAEEPMGSRHNYDPNVFDDMVDAIEYVESEGGYRRHDRYVDASLGGKYYSPYNLIRFTRPADVVMLSSGTYLWQISGVQPVYEPKWENIHTIMYKARGIIFADRDRNSRPRPKIHLVLEIYDTQGYGQPTNWETRQQIRLALSPDVKKYRGDSEPADGLWFFWWSGLTFNNEEHVSDWVYGRRLAEAIEMEVAAMTGHEGEIQSPTMPTRSRFVFPDNGAFNPKESAIPYELAYPGKVRIEVLNADMTLVDSYERGVQSAGLLHRFGGPHWTQSSSEPDGQYTFRLYVDSILMDTATVEVQSRPGLTSSSHIPQVWSNENVVTVTWKPNPSSKGISSFSYLWDTLYWSYPEKTYMLSAAQRELTSEPLEDGDSHYFHLRSRDRDGQWGSPVHIGPFYIDATPPSSISDIASMSHTVGAKKKSHESLWSTNNTINLSWTPPQDATSGLKGYSYLSDTSPSTLPPKSVNLGWGVTELSSSPLPDGQWYFHIRSVDLADNWENAATHFGPFRIDTQPPTPPYNLTSTSHTSRIWSNNNNITLSWQPAVDEGSGIAGYLSLWDESPDTIPTRITNPKATLRAKRSNLSEAKQSELRITNYRVITKLPDSNSLYFHLRSMDKAGQLSETTLHFGPFYIDTTPPSTVTEMQLFNSEEQPHNTDDWLTDGRVTVEWQPTKDEESGISEYEATLVNHQSSTFNLQSSIINLQSSPLSDGEWLFQVRARDVAGNLGAISELSIRVDSHIATPFLSSPSHPEQERWYSDNAPILIWTYENAGDADLSGIAEYRWAWDAGFDTLRTQPKSPTTVPDENDLFFADYLLAKNIKMQSLKGGTEQWTKSHVDDGVWYFHLVAVDNAGNISDVAHYKVQIDAAVPNIPVITSNTHPKDKWTAKKHLQFQWEIPPKSPLPPFRKGGQGGFPHSGIVGYSYLLDNSPTSMPDDELESTATSALFTDIDDGIWYFHLKVQSGAGTWSVPAHYAARIDTAIATPKLSSSSHPHSDQWYTDNKPTMTWTMAEDTSGIAGYSFVWNDIPTTTPDTKIEVPGNVNTLSHATALESELPTDGVWYFHLVAIDNASNVSEVVSYPIHLDTAVPAAPTIRSLTHPECQFYIFSRVLPCEKISQWTSEDQVEFTWQTPDSTSGIAGYSFIIDQNPKTFPKDQLTNTANKRDIQHLPDGIWYFHLKAQSRAGLWSETAHYEIRIDTTIPTPQLSSPSHPKHGQWYTDNVVTMTWTTSEDISGIAGYSFIFDHAPDTVPDRELDVSKNVNTIDSTLSTDGIWYFHLIAMDNAGNVSEVVSYPIYLDTATLAKPVITSATHPEGQWTSEDQVGLTWHLPTQSSSGQTNASGIEGYSFILDHKPTTTLPDYITTDVAEISYIHLADGIWYFHLKAFSGAGVWSPTAHYEIRIDTAIPTPQLSSPSHPKRGQWYNDNRVTMTWTIGEDISGIAGYSYVWDYDPDTLPDNEFDVSGDVTTLSHATATDNKLSENGVWYFHLMAIDNAKNVSDPVHYNIRIDSSIPSSPEIISTTHPVLKDGQWTANATLELNWLAPASASGIMGYSFLIDQKPATAPADKITSAGTSYSVAHLPDGVWYFHLKAQNGAGRWSPAAHYTVRVDTESPSIAIDFPRSDAWYTTPITEYYGHAQDAMSGVDWDTLEYRYGSIEWREFQSEESDRWRDIDEIPHLYETSPDAGGLLFQVRVRDFADNVGVSEPVKIRVDSSSPTLILTSPTHPDPNSWYADNQPLFRWQTDTGVSSIVGYNWDFNQQPETKPPENIMLAGDVTNFRISPFVSFRPPTDGEWYFHLRAQDDAGNWSTPYHYRVNIDTTPPQARISLHASNFVFSREYRHAKKNSDIIYQSTKSTILRVGTGTLNIRLTLSEPVPKGMTPILRCQPNYEIRNPKSEIRNPKGTRPFTLELIGDSLDWNAVMHVDMRTGDGKAEFQVETVDKAGNVGTEITEGKFFVIDTLLRADATETQYVLDERARVAISIPPSAFTQDIRIEIVPETTELSAIAVRNSYFGIRNLKAFDENFHALPIITFSKPIELTFGWREAAGDADAYTNRGQVPQIFYDDGVHTYRIGGTVKSDKITARVNHLGTFMIAMSKPIKNRIANGWAAPNPFTPNGSGDDTDRTIFQIEMPPDDNVPFTIKIFDITGRRVRTLEQGNRVWDGRDEHGRIVEGGVYIYQIRAGDEVISGTVVVVK